MRVKTAEMKNHLSRYLRHVRETGETITICDRDKPVAILAPAESKPSADPEWETEKARLHEISRQAGLVLHAPATRPPKLELPPPLPATDGRDIPDTIAWIRQSLDW